MTRGISFLIHDLSKCCFENHLTLTIQSIDDEKGTNKINRTNDDIILTLYESDDDDVSLAKEIELFLYNLKGSP